MVIAAALASALCYAAAMVLQQHGARQADGSASLRPGLVAELVRKPVWLAGVAANLLGYGLRFAALSRGSLVVVQPLLVTSLLFALPASARWHREGGLGGEVWASAAAIVVGLAMFLAAAGKAGNGVAPSGLSWLSAVIAIGLGSGLVVAVARGESGPRRAAMLAAAGGGLLAFTAALTKAVAVGLRADGLGVVWHWTPYALAVIGAASVIVTQSAFEAASLRASLPVLMVVEPLMSVALGVGLFGEHIAAGLPARSVEAVGLVLAGVGVVVLARREGALAQRESVPPGDVEREAV
jgi:drug/metabolite transporter (DMT)-like permease